jgi:DNA topoisomerase-3
VDFSNATALGACPKCRATVYEQPMAYVCEKSVGPNKSCDFRSGKVILQQEIAPEQMRKLLDTGRTDILRGFVSNKTRRKFSAFLVKKPDGGVGFEFEPRPAKGAGKPAGKSAGKSIAQDAVDGATVTAAEPAARYTAGKVKASEAKAVRTPAKSAAATKGSAAKPASPAKSTVSSTAKSAAKTAKTAKTAAKKTTRSNAAR